MMLTPAYKTPARYLTTMFGSEDQRTVAAKQLEQAAELMAEYRAMESIGALSYEEWQARMNALHERADWLSKQLGIEVKR